MNFLIACAIALFLARMVILLGAVSDGELKKGTAYYLLIPFVTEADVLAFLLTRRRGPMGRYKVKYDILGWFHARWPERIWVQGWGWNPKLDEDE